MFEGTSAELVAVRSTLTGQRLAAYVGGVGSEFALSNGQPPSSNRQGFPHLDHEVLPYNTMDHAERWAADMPGPAYAMDDETAIQVVDGTVNVVPEGHWKLFTP